jgi:GAF domain-containing protein
MFEFTELSTATKTEFYKALTNQLYTLLGNEHDLIANAANLSSLLFHTMPDLNWAGFYFYKQGELVLGPFQGKPACTRIALARGSVAPPLNSAKLSSLQTYTNFPGILLATKPQIPKLLFQ